MLFNSLVFLVFIGVFFPAYFLTSGRIRLWVCLLGSYLFYGWWDWRFLFLIFFITIFNWVMARWISVSTNDRVRFRLLWLSVACCLGLLGVFKYYGFFVDNLAPLLRTMGLSPNMLHLKILLPVGISFFTFQTMSYTIDVYRRNLATEPSLLRFATYVAFFPQLVAGPIVRARDFLPQLHVDHRLTWDNFVRGSMMVLWGYFLKCVVADSLAIVVDERFSSPYRFSAMDLSISVFFYAFQIYGDFAGYSFIAIGIARILGFDFGYNFDRPYFSTSFSNFWQRWHTSLSTWLRDYLYIPLGGNRGSQVMTYRNLMLTMLLGGLWHGASWNFVIWGGLHGCYLVVQNVLIRGSAPVDRGQTAMGRLLVGLHIATVFLLVCLGWVFFRAATFSDAIFIIHKSLQFGSYDFATVANKFIVLKGLLVIAILYGIEAFSFAVPFEHFLNGVRNPAWLIPMTVALAIMLSLFGTFGTNSFIYFQF